MSKTGTSERALERASRCLMEKKDIMAWGDPLRYYAARQLISWDARLVTACPNNMQEQANDPENIHQEPRPN